MALTSATETDLLLPLFTAHRENPRYSTFLERLRVRTQATYTALLIRRDAASNTPMQEYFAGEDLRKRARAKDLPDLFNLDLAHYDALRPGRVYAISELVDHDPVARTQRRQQMNALGLADERVVRVLAEADLHVWLVLARTSMCSASDSALLSSLSPYVAETVRTTQRIEQEHLSARINSVSLNRAGKAWIAFEREGRIAAIAPQAARWWETNKQHPPRIGERLLALPQSAQRALIEADTALSPAGRPIQLSESPAIEALLVPLDAPDTRGLTLALFSLPRAFSVDASDRLHVLHALPRREAELALLLAEGGTIAQAAQTMGLTVETARNYSKRIYAKLGVRGKSELVRLVLDGTAALS